MRHTLTRKVNYPIVLRMLGWLLMVEALFMFLPALVSWYYREIGTVVAFLGTAFPALIIGALMAYRIKPSSSSMNKREGLLLTSSVWVFFSLFGMVPFLVTGSLNTITDAFFETIAAFTTTGSTIVQDVEVLPHGILFWRSLMQWLGGMGIILFTLAVLPMLNYKGGITLFNAEVTGITHERLRPRVNQTAKDLWLVYLGLTVLLTLLLLPAMGGFDAVCHSMSTMSTGGFSTKNDSVGFWRSPYIAFVLMLFMFLGGVNFSLIYMAISGKFKKVWQSDVFKWYVRLIIICSAVVFVRMVIVKFPGTNLERAIFSVFDVLSAMTSTGFPPMSVEPQGEFIGMVLMVLMFFGGMAGSTSGGAKIDRLIVLIKNAKNELYRVLHPNTVTTVRIDGKALPFNRVSTVIAFLSMYVIIVIVVALLLVMMNIPMFDALYTSLSALSNLGVGYGITGADGSWAVLPDAAKWLLALEMLVGRLELFTVLVLFTSTFWLRD